MMRWSLSAEFLALILIVIQTLYFYEWGVAKTWRRKMYQNCLLASAAYIILNGICVCTLDQAQDLPLWVNHVLNSLYFWMSVGGCSVVAYYLFHLILEHVYDAHCIRRANILLITVNALFLPVVLTNWKTGLLFFFDAEKNYYRGPLNWLGYGFLAVELGALILCYIRNRPSVSKAMVKLMKILPPVVMLLVVFQLLYPDLLLNGMLMAVADLLLFNSFQSVQNEKDSLTNVGNRKSFFEEAALRIGGRQHFQVVLVALRQFGLVNQKYGHRRGDELLYRIASELDEMYHQGQAFRFGNVEFALLLPYTSEEASEEVLEQVRARFDREWVMGELSCQVAVCCASLCYEGQAWTPTRLIDFLERTIGQAMAEGPRSAVRFGPKVYSELERREKILGLIQRSLDQKKFQVWYQPVWEPGTGLSTAEALLRMKDEEGNAVSPAEFIPLAEQTGLINELTWLVMEQACALLERTEPERLKSVSINLSMQQFADRQLADRVLSCLSRHNLTPDRLKLEVTERVLYQDAAYMRRIMADMADRGLQFYLDDFGTGYSNLENVRTFPFSYVKLDQSLLQGFPEDKEALLVVDSMIRLFHGLGLKVVVEGVEEKAQLDRLTALGADRIQGFYCARPMPEEDFEKLLCGTVK